VPASELELAFASDHATPRSALTGDDSRRLPQVATIAHPHLEPSEFLALQSSAGWNMAVELIDGQAVVMPPSGAAASSVQGELFFAVRSWQQAAKDGGLLLQDVFVELPGHQVLAPDIAWWSKARRPAIELGAISVVPELVVEVLSPATRTNDLGVKRERYLAVGVGELWLADPAAKTLTRARPAANDEELSSQETLTTELLNGFSLALSRVFSTT
jgi:Uma2 family endonuclease